MRTLCSASLAVQTSMNNTCVGITRGYIHVTENALFVELRDSSDARALHGEPWSPTFVLTMIADDEEEETEEGSSLSFQPRQ